MNIKDVLRRAGLTASGVDVTISAGYIRPNGRTQTVGGTSVRVLARDNTGLALLATGTTIPAAAGANWAKGAVFIKTNGVTGVNAVYINVGTTASANFAKISDNRLARVTLTNANLKNLRATPITLVAAPGASLLLQFVDAILINNGGANALTESTYNMAIKYTNGSGVVVSQTIETTGFIDQTVKTVTNALAKIDAIVTSAASFNQALVLHNTGAAEFGGNAANDVTMDVIINYRVLDVA